MNFLLNLSLVESEEKIAWITDIEANLCFAKSAFDINEKNLRTESTT